MNKKKTFNLLLIAQSLGAFSDNAVYSVIMGMLLELVKSNKIDLARFGVDSAIYANCLFLPYVLFAPVLGFLSDRFTKRNILITANIIRASGCFLALIGASNDTNLMIAAYLLVGMGAAVYSPSKYGIIPELKEEKDLVKANAAMEMATIFSILIGIICGAILVDTVGPKGSFFILTMVYLSASILNFFMDKSYIRNENEIFIKSVSSFKQSLQNILSNRYLYIPVIGTTIFWLSGSFIKLNLQTWGQYTLKLQSATSISLLALWLSIGIIFGSFTAGRKFQTGQIKQSWYFGLFMGIVIVLMAIKYFGYGVVICELILVGGLGGLFLIPLNAVIQARSEHKHIGKTIAIQNSFENGAMLLSSGMFWFLNKISMSPDMTFIFLGGVLCALNIVLLRPLLKKL